MFCCRHGPLVACATPRFASPFVIRCATSPMRIKPAHITAFAASAPPDGLMFVSPFEPEGLGEDQLLVAELRVQLGHVDRCPCRHPPRRAAAFVDSEVVRSRTPRLCASMRCSMPRIHAGRLDTLRATSPAASTIAAEPSVIGEMSASRNG